MEQDIFDLIVVLTLVFFAGRGYLNGFIEEVAGFASLLGGFWAARLWHPFLAARLNFISEPSWRVIAAYVLIFLAVILLVGILARVLQKILTFSFALWADKTIGLLVGFAKGLLLCALLLMILQKFFSGEPFMRLSRTLPYLDALMQMIRGWLPQELRSGIGL
jgi:membrane protein required for colicin V production